MPHFTCPSHPSCASKALHTTRRQFINNAAGLSVLATVGTLGCRDIVVTDRKLIFQSLSQAMQEAQRLAKLNGLEPATIFTLPQTLTHCAQSIEYSISGFPESKSAIFQRTVGSAAYQVFSWRGRMSHNLSEAIPGAPELDQGVGMEEALLHLQAAVQRFDSHRQPLQPHFAFGVMNKIQYEHAHAMHLANHFSAIGA